MLLNQCNVSERQRFNRRRWFKKENIIDSFLFWGFHRPQLQLVVSRRLPPRDQNWREFRVPWFNSSNKDAGGLKAWSTVTICLFFYTNITISCSKHGMHATELSSFQMFLRNYLIHCNNLLQLRHPAIQLPTSSLASQLSLNLKIKKTPQKTSCSQDRNNNTVWMKSVTQSLK